jgi:hypothetical protein
MTDLRQKIEAANEKAVSTMMEAEPVLVDIRRAINVIPGMQENMVLHSGPPVSWQQMSPTQRHGVIGAVLHEKLAGDSSEAEKMCEREDIHLEPCHEHDTVGSMAGITSASNPVFVVKNKIHGNVAYHQLFFDGPGRQASRLTMGVYNDEVEQALCWRRDVLGPALKTAIDAAGGIPLKPIIARALNMGDECHNRCAAGTYRFNLEIVPHMLHAGVAPETIARFMERSAENEQFFLFLSMPACKVMADVGHKIPYSTVVTCMARNGTESGIRVSGLGNQWFRAPSPPITKALYFSSQYTLELASHDMGDSTITETVGLGGFALVNAPAFMETVGGTVKNALDYHRQMQEITVDRNRNFLMPFLDFQGSPIGIDIRLVVAKDITPVCDTGIAAKNGGFIGLGIVRQPLDMFKKALKAFNEKYCEEP